MAPFPPISPGRARTASLACSALYSRAVPLRVLHLSSYDANGGAARAAYGLHRAMLGQGVSSQLLVGRKGTDDPTVKAGGKTRFLVAGELDRRLWRLQRSSVVTWRSPARFGSISADQINRSGADVVNLHWVTDGFLSIEQIGRIELPIVWSMYDMWPFAGTEHYGADTPDARWRTGYTKTNRPADESGFDLDRWAFERKVRQWTAPRHTAPMHMVPASTWLADAVKSSALMRDWPVTRIPHVVDTDVFAPMPKEDARRAIGVPEDAPTVVFLASAGIGDHRKGWDLLAEAMPPVVAELPNLQVVVVGPVPDDATRAVAEQQTKARIHWHGTVDSSEALRTLYCAGDVTAVPSREDNMPLTAMEAQSCGRSVVAFDIGGLPDIVEHGETGYLAKPFDTADLAGGLIAELTSTTSGEAARARALKTWSPASVVPRYLKIYSQH